jgi:tyrosyl-tRNA synthetase
MKNFVEELRWRGMLKDIMPGTEELLLGETVTAYIGFDPTADSLHVGSLVQIMLLTLLQRCGHKPIALVGGATGMIGDPSGKKEERKLLSAEDINHNVEGIKKQLEKFLDFSVENNPAVIVNNGDWFKGITTIDFLRDVGKHLSINYLLGKAFVKDRLAQESEFSFTEFNYILMQSYDFLWLYQNKNCKLQMGGSDQWGNITAGAELIRKKIRGEAYGLTCPLMTKADGTKFGKTESGNVWLDAKRTSPYKFYQFWLNSSDDDVKNYIRIFTLMSKEEVESLEAEHAKAPHQRLLQKTLAKEITIRVHSEKDFDAAVEASEILFGKGTSEALNNLSEEDLLSVFEGVPQMNVAKAELETGINVVEFFSDKTQIFPSRGEARKMIQGGGVFLNKNKVEDINRNVRSADLLKEKYILAQKGKKNYYLITANSPS